MREQKLVSIIILTYNNFKYIFECLDSVIEQKYQNIQLIISDDGSANFPKEEIENFIVKNKNENITLYSILGNKNNHGTVKNFNKSLEYTNGEYIIPLAGDDVFYDCNVISKFVENFDSLDGGNLLLTSQVENCDIDLEKHISYSFSQKHIDIMKNREALFYELCNNCFIPSGGTAYRRAFFEEYGKFDERYTLVEDWPTFLKLARKFENISFQDFISVKHRDGGVSHSNIYGETQKKYHKDLIEIMSNEIIPYINILPDEYKKKIVNLCKDKKTIYQLRFEFKEYGFYNKVMFMIKNRLLVSVIIRRFMRRFY